MTFKASLDNLTKGITVCVTLIILFGILTELSLYFTHNSRSGLFVAIIIFAVYVFAYAYHPVAYELKGDTLIIKRPFSNVVINKSDIQNVALVDVEKVNRNTIRTCGVGGLFGYYGRFANPELGGMTWYATNTKNTVLICLCNNKKIVLTPDEPESFVASMMKPVNI